MNPVIREADADGPVAAEAIALEALAAQTVETTKAIREELEMIRRVTADAALVASDVRSAVGRVQQATAPVQQQFVAEGAIAASASVGVAPGRTLAEPKAAQLQRRQAARTPGVGIRAILIGGERAGLAVTVKDLSPGGLAMLSDWQADAGEAVAVVLDGVLAPIAGRVIRAQHGVVAVAFSQDEANRALVNQALSALGGQVSRAG